MNELARVAVLLSVFLVTACAPTSNGLVVESVDDYTLRNPNPLPNSVANGYGFEAIMLNSWLVPGGPWYRPYSWNTSPWKLVAHYDDRRVADADLMDGDLSRGGVDQWNFDSQGVAISYFTGHGDCTDGCSAQSCTSTTSCTTPVAGSRLPGTCRYSPMDAPRCCYLTDRQALTAGNYDINSGRVNYTSGPVRWGESPTSGPWANAGTNGGTNLVVLDISCPVLPPFWTQQLQNAFGGVHMIATLLVAGGDTNNVSDRGKTFAWMWASNPNGSVAQAWLDTMSSLPVNDGDACVDRSGNTVGGGRGVNGCGCNIIVAMDESSKAAFSKFNEDWSELRADDRDAKGNGWYVAGFQCNYPLPARPPAAWELP